MTSLKLICRVVSITLAVEGGSMLLPVLIAFLYGEKRMIAAFLASLTLCILLGGLLHLISAKRSEKLHAREGFMAVAFSWIALSVFGAIPLCLSGCYPNPCDALFESCSGFTTTGATLIGNLESLPRSILFWRSLSQWMGGMGVLALMLALAPKRGAGSVFLMRAESPGPIKAKLTPKLGTGAKILCAIYGTLTCVETVCLRIAGMPWYDSVIHAMSTVATGGFSCRTDSLAAYDSMAVNAIVVIFMFLASLNFSLLYLVFIKRTTRLFDNGEFKVYLRMLLIAAALICIDLICNTDIGALNALGHAVFQVVSLSSTTAFVSTDYGQWPPFSQMLLLIIMAIGGCASSTAGGMKMQRVSLLFRIMYRQVNAFIHPRVVRSICVDKHRVEEPVLSVVSLYFFSYIVLILFLAAFAALDGHSLGTSLSAAIACVSNTGTGIELAGPSSTFNVFSAPTKIVFCLGMVAGRLEIMPMLLLLFPAAWKR